MRDLQADLEICRKATPGPWVDLSDTPLEKIVAVSNICYQTIVLTDEGDRPEDYTFIVAAREGWPHAIERAMAAETKIVELEAQAAVMREAIEHTLIGKHGTAYILGRKAISEDAGKKMILRLNRLKEAIEAIAVIAAMSCSKNCEARVDDETGCGNDECPVWQVIDVCDKALGDTP